MLIELKTERLFLRPLNMGDLFSTHDYVGNEENAKYMIYFPNETVNETKDFLLQACNEWNKEKPTFYEFAIMLEDKHIGTVSLYLNEDYSEGELGWIIHRNFWGNGYATESAIAIKEFAINQLNIKKLFACCDSRNKSSYSIMNKIGMTLENNDAVRVNKNSNIEVKELLYSLYV